MSIRNLTELTNRLTEEKSLALDGGNLVGKKSSFFDRLILKILSFVSSSEYAQFDSFETVQKIDTFVSGRLQEGMDYGALYNALKQYRGKLDLDARAILDKTLQKVLVANETTKTVKIFTKALNQACQAFKEQKKEADAILQEDQSNTTGVISQGTIEVLKVSYTKVKAKLAECEDALAVAYQANLGPSFKGFAEQQKLKIEALERQAKALFDSIQNLEKEREVQLDKLGTKLGALQDSLQSLGESFIALLEKDSLNQEEAIEAIKILKNYETQETKINEIATSLQKETSSKAAIFENQLIEKLSLSFPVKASEVLNNITEGGQGRRYTIQDLEALDTSKNNIEAVKLVYNTLSEAATPQSSEALAGMIRLSSFLQEQEKSLGQLLQVHEAKKAIVQTDIELIERRKMEESSRSESPKQSPITQREADLRSAIGYGRKKRVQLEAFIKTALFGQANSPEFTAAKKELEVIALVETFNEKRNRTESENDILELLIRGHQSNGHVMAHNQITSFNKLIKAGNNFLLTTQFNDLSAKFSKYREILQRHELSEGSLNQFKAEMDQLQEDVFERKYNPSKAELPRAIQIDDDEIDTAALHKIRNDLAGLQKGINRTVKALKNVG